MLEMRIVWTDGRESKLDVVVKEFSTPWLWLTDLDVRLANGIGTVLVGEGAS